MASSTSVDPALQALLLDRLGPTVAVAASDTRSQARNRELALGRLCARVAGALEQRRPRRPTRPSLASRRRRLESKRRVSERKAGRRGGWEDR